MKSKHAEGLYALLLHGFQVRICFPDGKTVHEFTPGEFISASSRNVKWRNLSNPGYAKEAVIKVLGASSFYSIPSFVDQVFFARKENSEKVSEREYTPVTVR
jgi:hypothetical protein